MQQYSLMSVSKQWTNQKTPEAGQAFVYSSKLTWQLPLCKNPPSLVTVATFDKPCRSHATRYHVVKNTSRSRQETDYTPVSAFLRNSNNKYSCVALKCVVKDHCIVLIVQAAHVNRSSFRIYLKHELKQEWTSECILFQPRKDVNTQFYAIRIHFSSLSPPKLIYSPVWFVCLARWWILRYYWSDRVSIKHFENGQLVYLTTTFFAVFLKPQIFSCY